MFERKATKKELMQLIVEQSNSEVTKLRAENNTLRAELAALKADKQPLIVDNTSNLDETHDRLDVIQEGDCVTFVRKDALGNIVGKIVATPNGVIATANKITLNGVDVSGMQM